MNAAVNAAERMLGGPGANWMWVSLFSAVFFFFGFNDISALQVKHVKITNGLQSVLEEHMVTWTSRIIFYQRLSNYPLDVGSLYDAN